MLSCYMYMFMHCGYLHYGGFWSYDVFNMWRASCHIESIVRVMFGKCCDVMCYGNFYNENVNTLNWETSFS